MKAMQHWLIGVGLVALWGIAAGQDGAARTVAFRIDAQPVERADDFAVPLAPAGRRKDPAARNEELGPRQRLGAGKVLEGRSVALGRIPIRQLERDIDRVGIAAELIVADTPLLDQ